MSNISFPYYPAEIKKCKPLGNVSLLQFISAIKNPKEKVKKVFAQIAKAESDKDFKLKTELKTRNLYYFNPCVNTDGKWRSYDNITSFTGLMVLDFDHIDYAEELRDDFFNEFKFCVAALVSGSKMGCKMLIKIPVVNTVDEFKEYFYGLAHHLEVYEGFDGTAQSPILPLFLSYDPDVKYRPYDQAETWLGRGFKKDSFDNDEYEFDASEIGDVTPRDCERARNVIRRSIDKIENGGGHYAVRSASILCGGFVGIYFSEEDGWDLLEQTILSNQYLSKDYKGYLKTARQMMRKGMTKPTKLKDET